MFYLCFAWNEWGAYGLPLSVVERERVRSEYPGTKILLEFTAPSKQIFQPLPLLSSRTWVHKMEPRPTPDGPVFIVKTTGLRLLEWVALQGVKSTTVRKICCISKVAPQKRKESLLSAICRALHIEPGSARFEKLNIVYNRAFVLQCKKEEGENSDFDMGDCNDDKYDEDELSQVGELEHENGERADEWEWINSDDTKDITCEWETQDRKFFQSEVQKRQQKQEKDSYATRNQGTYQSCMHFKSNVYLYRVARKKHYLAMIKDLTPNARFRKTPFDRKQFSWGPFCDEQTARSMARQYIKNKMVELGHTPTSSLPAPRHDPSSAAASSTAGQECQGSDKERNGRQQATLPTAIELKVEPGSQVGAPALGAILPKKRGRPKKKQTQL